MATATIPRGLGLALAATGPVAIGGILAATSHAVAPVAAAPAIVFGVAAATAPALYIAIATTGDAPPLSVVVRAFAVAIAAFGIALAGLVLPAAFLSLSSTSTLTTKLVCTAALGTAGVLAAWRLGSELAPRSLGAIIVCVAWAIATLGIGARLWWDLASEVLPAIATEMMSPPARGSFGTVDLLLRDRPLLLARIAGGDVAGILKTMMATIAIAMAIVGAALGSYRGDVQIVYAAIKLPLVLLGTAALSAPALTAIGCALGRPARLAQDLALVMSALAFGALLLCACTPIVMLARALEVGYHDTILIVVVLFAFAGIASLRVVIGALARRGDANRGAWAAIAGMCVVFVLVGGQLAWALRPYLVRPRAQDVPFVREVEGGLIDAVIDNARSARGIYTRDEAPLP